MMQAFVTALAEHGLRIDPEFAALHEPLQPAEGRLLEESVRERGVLSPIVAWDLRPAEDPLSPSAAPVPLIVVDGHNRLQAAFDSSQPFGEVVYIKFANRAAAIRWILENQLARRNLTDAQRIKLAERLKEHIAVEAAARMKAGKAAEPEASKAQGQTDGDGDPSAKMRQGPTNHDSGKNKSKGKTSELVAEMSGVSPRTVEMHSQVTAEGGDELKKAMQDGRIPISSAAKALKLPKEKQDQLSRLDKKGFAAAVALETKKLSGKPVETTGAVDQLGQPFPAGHPEIAEAFARTAEIKGFMHDLSVVKSAIKKKFVRGECLDPLYCRLNVRDFTQALDSAIDMLQGIQPYTACPYCREIPKKDCEVCDGRLFVDKKTYEAAVKDPKEVK